MPSTETLPSGKYRAIYRVPGGKKRYVKGTFKQQKAALYAAAAAEADAMSLGWRDPKAALRPWGDWCDEWWPSRQVEAGTLKRDASSRDSCLMKRWKEVPLSEITRHDIKAWAAQLQRGGMAPATVEKRVYLLSSSLNAAVDAEIISTNPAFRLKITSAGQSDERRYLTHEEARIFLAQFRPPVDDLVNEAAVLTLLGTGMRWGEMVGLQIKRVDLDRQMIRVAEVWDTQSRQLVAYPKGKLQRSVPIPPTLAPYIQGVIGDRRSGHVFLRDGYVLDYSNWRKRFWLTAEANADIGHVRIHDLRHTFASWLLQHPTNPVALAEVGRLLGHKSPQTTAIYAHLTEAIPMHVTAALPSF